MQDNIEEKLINELFKAITRIDSEKECSQFFEDICTVNEIKSLAQRLQVAKMLKKSHTYHRIVEETHASTATISRVNRALQYGAGGYNAIIEKLEEN